MEKLAQTFTVVSVTNTNDKMTAMAFTDVNAAKQVVNALRYADDVINLRVMVTTTFDARSDVDKYVETETKDYPGYIFADMTF